MYYDSVDVFAGWDVIDGHYVGAFIDAVGDADRYLVVRVKPERLPKLRSGMLDLHTLLLEAPGREWYLTPSNGNAGQLLSLEPQRSYLKKCTGRQSQCRMAANGRGLTMGSTTLETIREVPDHLWKQIRPVILELNWIRPKLPAASAPNPSLMRNGIIFRLRSGGQWNRSPRELDDNSTIHRTCQRWVQNGVFPRIWAVPSAECAELGGVV